MNFIYSRKEQLQADQKSNFASLQLGHEVDENRK